MWTLLFLLGPLGGLASPVETPPGLPAQTLRALHCPPCERIHCSTRRALRLQCRGGVTTGVCGCCPACARTEGEPCGGAWDYRGKCDEGLVCVYEEEEGPGGGPERSGVCKAVIESVNPESCQPECTREYCRAHPSAICSARFAAVERSACHGSCRHTSCSSCLLLRGPACSHACAPSDPACMRHFGRCVHNHLSERSVCSSELQSDSEGLLLCLLPACSDSTLEFLQE